MVMWRLNKSKMEVEVEVEVEMVYIRNIDLFKKGR